VAAAALAAVAQEENGNMKKSEFIQQLDHPAIEGIIAETEALTSGEIRVVVTHDPAPDPLAAAQAAFERLGMTKTKNRNAVLIFVAPASQTFAVIGDEAVHQKCGDDFWQEMAAAMSEHFKKGAYTSGLRHGIELAGALLAEHFPRQPNDANELPNTVIEE
jgi:uncharacterized membrane protein